MQHVETGTYKWVITERPKPLWIRLLVTASKIEVFIFMSTNEHSPAVRLFVHRGNQIKFEDLYGKNGDGEEFRRKGLGALAVNTAIATLSAISSPTAHVYGLLSNPSDEPSLKEAREEARRCFWESFGMNILDRGAPVEHINCTVEDLYQSEGSVLGQHNRKVNLSNFTKM